MFETPTFIKVNSLSGGSNVTSVGCTNVIQVDFRFVVILIDSQLSWNVLLLLCIVSKLHSWFLILPGNNEDEMNI